MRELEPHSYNHCQGMGLTEAEINAYMSGYMVQQKRLHGSFTDKEVRKYSPDPELLGAVMVKLYGEDDESESI